MSKFETRLIRHSDRSFKKKFEDLIFKERKLTNKINVTVSKIVQKNTFLADLGVLLAQTFGEN